MFSSNLVKTIVSSKKTTFYLLLTVFVLFITVFSTIKNVIHCLVGTKVS